MRRNIDIDLNGTNRGASGALRGVGRDAEGLSSKLASIGKKVAKSMAVIGVAGAVAVGAGLAHAVEAGLESQKIARETERVVQSTGHAANVSAKHIGDYSAKLSELTGVDDELIQQNANLLTTFTKVRNEVGDGNNVWDRGVAIALDMAEVMGGDVQGAMVQVGKALNDPIKGMTALTRAGVSFTQQQKDQVRAMVEAGDTLGAQKLILDEMAVQFGGAAETAATPMDRLKVAIGNVEEEIGETLIPTVEGAATWLGDKLPSAVEWGRSTLADLAPTVERVRDTLLDAGQRAVPYVVDAFHDLVETGQNVWEILQTIGREVGPTVEALADFGGTAVLSGIQRTAEAVQATTGYFAENEDAVRLVISAVLVLAGVAAWAAIISALETMYIHWLYFAQAVGATSVMTSLRNIVTGFGMIGASALTMGQSGAGGIAMIQTGLTGLAATVGPVVAVVGAVYGLMTLFRSGKGDAEDFANSLVKVGDAWDVEGMKSSLESVTTTLDEESAKWEGSGFWSRLGRAATEILPGVDNGIITTRRNMDALSATSEELAGSIAKIDERAGVLSSTLGLSEEEVRRWMETLKLDPQTMGYEEMEAAIVDAATAASASTPQTDALGASYGVLADQASSATDQLSAYKEIVDAIFGATMSTFEAQTNYGGALDDLTASIYEHGRSLDSDTEAGRANRDALQSAADAALGWAESVAATGDYKGAADTLTMLREQITGAAEDFLGSRSAAETFVDSIGLTDDKLAELASGVADPANALSGIQDQLDVLGGTVAEPGVTVNTDDAYSTMADFAPGFAAWMNDLPTETQVGIESSEAAGKMEQMQVMMDVYAQSNPMAVAWLDSQPAEVKAAALAEFTRRWEEYTPYQTFGIILNESSAAAAQRRVDAITADRTINVNLRVVGNEVGMVTGAGAGVRRWGGIHETARMGRLPADVYTDPTILFGERATGGEAMIPRLGDFARSAKILAKAASWYGLQVVDPQAEMAAGWGGADTGEWDRWHAAESGATRSRAGAATELAAPESRALVVAGAPAPRNTPDEVTLRVDRLQLVAPDGKVLAEEVDVTVLAKRVDDRRRGRA